jgi:cation:H+ antiporter
VAGQPDLALGNVVGSNIFNVLFILGLSALIAPLVVSHQLVRMDVPLMIGVSVLLLLLALDGRVERLEGAMLFAGIVAYTSFLIRQGLRSGRGDATEAEAPPSDPVSPLTNIAWILGGLAALVLGSRWLVTGSVDVARAFGISELVIGLTILAAGTSMPEVATSIMATLRGARDIAVGNVVGSNIFNILAVLGLSSAIAPEGIAVTRTAITFDIPVMTVVAFACLPIFVSGYRIARWEGLLFMGYYVAYTAYLVVHALDHPALPAFRTAMLGFVLPLTAVTLLVVGVRSWRAR